MTVRIAENLDISSRYIGLETDTGLARDADTIYVTVPCTEASHGEHVLGFDRAHFRTAMREVLGLVDPLELQFALPSASTAG